MQVAVIRCCFFCEAVYVPCRFCIAEQNVCPEYCVPFRKLSQITEGMFCGFLLKAKAAILLLGRPYSSLPVPEGGL